MKKLLLLLLLILIACSEPQRINYNELVFLESDNRFYTKENILYTGIIVNEHSNGQLKYEQYFLDGRPEGNMIVYHSNGNVQNEDNWSNGETQGVAKEYHYNGKLKGEKFYQNGVLQGKEKTYNINGTLESVGDYKDGKLHGTTVNYGYDENDIQYIFMTLTWENGAMNGEFVIYHDLSFSRAQEGNYKDSEYHGAVTTYHSSDNKFSTGGIRFVENYKDGIRHGIEESYYLNGQLERTRIFKNGEIDGEAKKYYENGKIESSGTLVPNGDDFMTLYTYYEDGITLQSKNANKITFPDGIILSHGLTTDYTENGKLFMERNFKDDLLHGRSKVYHPNGQLKGNVLYENGMDVHAMYYDEEGNFEFEVRDGKMQ